jgi:hypothetical protein
VIKYIYNNLFMMSTVITERITPTVIIITIVVYLSLYNNLIARSIDHLDKLMCIHRQLFSCRNMSLDFHVFSEIYIFIVKK